MTEIINNKQEQGRSMVEMLGVLAIIGVLSVGGIAGYTYAMNRYYANELLNGASQRAMILKSQKAAGLDLSLREFDGMEVAGGEFSLDVLDADGSVGIAVSRVKGAVCKNLIKATEGTDIGIAQKADDNTLSDITEEACDDANDNELVFVFETGLGGNSDEPKDPNTCDPACEDNKVCIGGICVGTKQSCPFFIEYCDEDYETGEKNCYTELSSVCSEICSEGEEGELICDTSEETNCIYNSDCDDWCQDKEGDCFCLLSGEDGISSGECALVDDYSSTDPYSRMTWFSANNWCQAQGSTIYSLTTEVLDNGEIVDADDIRSTVCCEVGNCGLNKPTSIRVNFTLNGQPAKVECSSNGLVRIHEGYAEYTPLCN